MTKRSGMFDILALARGSRVTLVNRDIFTRAIFISLGGVSTGNVVALDQFFSKLANASANDQTFTTISLCSTFQLFDTLQLGNVEPTNWYVIL